MESDGLDDPSLDALAEQDPSILDRVFFGNLAPAILGSPSPAIPGGPPPGIPPYFGGPRATGAGNHNFFLKIIFPSKSRVDLCTSGVGFSKSRLIQAFPESSYT